jgi:hypothetical protein
MSSIEEKNPNNYILAILKQKLPACVVDRSAPSNPNKISIGDSLGENIIYIGSVVCCSHQRNTKLTIKQIIKTTTLTYYWGIRIPVLKITLTNKSNQEFEYFIKESEINYHITKPKLLTSKRKR